MDLGEMGEFGLLERVRGWIGPGEAALGFLDDAAVLDSLVATTDALVEDVHFRLDWSTPTDVGFKAVSVNVSDLAAMGAEPRWALVALAAPRSTSADVLRGLFEGLAEACSRYGVDLVGGDTVSGPALMLSVTALGALDGPPLLRSGARPGNVLAVTGPLGRSAAGLALYQAGSDLSSEAADACRAVHRRPEARPEAGLALRRSGLVRAGMDLSDGLLSDVRRIAEASSVGVVVDPDAVPVASEAREVADALGADPFTFAAGGGEDLELLVALDPDDLDRARVPLHRVGAVVPDGLWLATADGRDPLPVGGWDHFSGAR